ncbi:hypothetical protein BDY24DRAFT_402819 [Mrakia frigida]|uniref:uncharacterized protein n=1 Tax=Mrakia frigida TaxID=29902 RepID=UPI003FCC0A1E
MLVFTQAISLRSFVPSELVNHILSELTPPPSPLSCLVSFACLEEGGPILYRDVVIHSNWGLVSYTCSVGSRSTPFPLSKPAKSLTYLPSLLQMSLPQGSRLQPYLSLTLTRNITFDSVWVSPYGELASLFRQERTPPRLAQLPSPLLLLRLLVTTFRGDDSDEVSKTLHLFNSLILPYFQPIHFELRRSRLVYGDRTSWTCRTRFNAPGPGPRRSEGGRTRSGPSRPMGGSLSSRSRAGTSTRSSSFAI